MRTAGNRTKLFVTEFTCLILDSGDKFLSSGFTALLFQEICNGIVLCCLRQLLLEFLTYFDLVDN